MYINIPLCQYEMEQEEKRRKEEKKKQQSKLRLEQLQTIRANLAELAERIDSELSNAASERKITTLMAKKIGIETRLYNLDSQIAILWDAVYA